MNLYFYKAFVTEVYDGDTLTADIDLGFNVWLKGIKIRLADINAPEVRGEEKEQGIKSRDRLRELVLNKEILLETVKDTQEKYGRWLGNIYINSELINEKLITEGLAKIYK